MEKLKTRQKLNDDGTPKKKTTRESSTDQEKQIAKSLKAKRTSNSGATFFGKGGDLIKDDWTIEAKTCQSHKKSFSIKKEWIEKLRFESLHNGTKHNALAFQFGPEEENFYIIDENTFNSLFLDWFLFHILL